MKKRKLLIYSIVIVLLLISGCSSKDAADEETSVLEAENEVETVLETSSEIETETETTSQAPTQPTTQVQTQPPTLDLYTEASNNKSNNWSYCLDVLTYVNGYRSEVGAAPLVLSEELSMAASIRATEMVRGTYLEHQRPDGRSWHTILGECSIPYTTAGENIAGGYGDVARICNGWRTSTSGHYEAMINTGYGKVGVGVAFFGTNRGVWVLIFTN